MEKLLQHYEQELSRLREATRRYAEAHANTAAALELGPDASTDPEVERLLQSVALLNATTQQMIEDGRSEFHRALLQTLQPHYLRVVPACGIVQIDTSSARPNEISTVNRLPRGASLNSGSNKFVTAYEASIAPVAITEVRFQATIDLPASLRLPSEATSALVIELQSIANSVYFSQPPVRKLRIHIDGEASLRAALLDAILLHSRCVCLELNGSWKTLRNTPFSAVGTGDDEALLPARRGPQSPRILSEFFHLPQKFEFVDLDLELLAAACPPVCQRIALHIVLPSCNPRLRAANAGKLRLGCVPVINIFHHPATPIRLDGRSGAYPLVPQQPGCEIYSVESVSLVKANGEQILPPFHGTEHCMPGPYWQLDEEDGFAIKFVDRDQLPFKLEAGTVSVRLTCTNINPLQGAANLTTEKSSAGFPIQFLGELTAPGFSPDYGELAESLYTEDTTLPALCKQLQLHGCKYTESLKGLVARPSTAWLEHPMGRVHMHGTEFTLLIDEPALQEHSIYVLAEVLAITLADKLRENRFAQLRIANEAGQLLHCAQPRIGTRPLL